MLFQVHLDGPTMLYAYRGLNRCLIGIQKRSAGAHTSYLS
jgi:hypothetical protein